MDLLGSSPSGVHLERSFRIPSGRCTLRVWNHVMFLCFNTDLDTWNDSALHQRHRPKSTAEYLTKQGQPMLCTPKTTLSTN